MDFLSSFKRRIDRYLSDYLISQSKIHATFPWGTDIIAKLLPFTTSGKTIRGSLVLLACEGYGTKITDDVVRVASALELIHSGLLIHDDIMDNDRIRRKTDSIFVQYENGSKHQKQSDKTDFGKNMAICFADAAFFIAIQLINDCKDTVFSTKLLSYLLPEYTAVCFAQMQDIYFGSSQSFPNESDILTMYRYKTARYTFSLPLYAGALYAKTDTDQLHSLVTIGEHMGILFQLTDDMLNIYGKQKTTGKSVLSDITGGKKTFLMSTLYQKATTEEQHTIQASLSCDYMTSTQQTYIMGLLKKYAIRQHVQSYITDYSGKAKQRIMELSIAETQKRQLTDLVSFLETRSS